MRFSFRLAELINHNPDPKKRPGTIKAICEHTGLDRHQVAALLKNEAKYIPLKALSRLCDYLVEHGHVPAEQLPGALFAVEPEHFWELLARRRRLELCVGVRYDEEMPEKAWVMASDSVLLGSLLNGVSSLGGTASYNEPTGAPLGLPVGSPPHPERLEQRLVRSPETSHDYKVHPATLEVYERFHHSNHDRALVCVGSQKSNPVGESVIAHSFGCQAHRSQDDVQDPHERDCPFFMRYREYDPHPPSCLGGMRLSVNEPGAVPGIYYETDDGSWHFCKWDEDECDVAFLFYIHRESQARMEMVLGGYSGRATRLLSRTLETRAEDFWPPVYSHQGIQIGAYVVRYTFDPKAGHLRDPLEIEPAADTQIIPLSHAVIARRLQSRRTPRRASVKA